MKFSKDSQGFDDLRNPENLEYLKNLGCSKLLEVLIIHQTLIISVILTVITPKLNIILHFTLRVTKANLILF